MTKEKDKDKSEVTEDFVPSVAKIPTMSIVETILSENETYQDLAEIFANFEFFGKKLLDWSRTLRVEIPDKMTGAELRKTNQALAKSIQMASHYNNLAYTILHALESGLSIKRASKIEEIVGQYAAANAKRPAATVITQMADNSSSDAQMSRATAKIVKNFFQQNLDTLIEVRRILEQIGISHGSELKYLDNSMADDT